MAWSNQCSLTPTLLVSVMSALLSRYPTCRCTHPKTLHPLQRHLLGRGAWKQLIAALTCFVAAVACRFHSAHAVLGAQLPLQFYSHPVTDCGHNSDTVGPAPLTASLSLCQCSKCTPPLYNVLHQGKGL